MLFVLETEMVEAIANICGILDRAAIPVELTKVLRIEHYTHGQVSLSTRRALGRDLAVGFGLLQRSGEGVHTLDESLRSPIAPRTPSLVRSIETDERPKRRRREKGYYARLARGEV